MTKLAVTGTLRTLGAALIEFVRRVLHSRLLGREISGFALYGTAFFLSVKYDKFGDIRDLETSLVDFQQSLLLVPTGRFYRRSVLANFGATLYSKYTRLERAQDIEDAITNFNEALSLFPRDHRRRYYTLNYLSSSLRRKYEHFGDIQDLELAVAHSKEALLLCPIGHKSRSWTLGNFACALLARYETKGDVQDLEQAISYHREEVSLEPTGHPSRPISLKNLGNALFANYERSGDVQQLEDVIATYAESLALRPVGHPDRPWSLDSLGSALRMRFARNDHLEDLELSIAYHKEAYSLLRRGHALHAANINNLATSLLARYTHSGAVADLEDAITYHREAFQFFGRGGFGRSISLHNLGVALRKRYDRLGDLYDLGEAIAFLREALSLMKPGHTTRATCLNNLSRALQSRFDRLGETQDLEGAIALNKEALALIPAGSLNRAYYLNRLTEAWQSKYQTPATREEFEEAVNYQKEALSLCPPGHPDRVSALSIFGQLLLSRFTRFWDKQDLEDAIAYQTEALALRPPGHPHRLKSLYNLANTLMARSRHGGEDHDMEEAIQMYREALSLYPAKSPDLAGCHDSLALALQTRYRRLKNVADIQELQVHALAAAQDRFYNVHHRLKTALYWANQVATEQPFRLAIYSQAIALLQQLLVANPDIEKQQDRLLSATFARELPGRAAACAIENGNLELAVSLSEQCRSVLLSNLQRYRSPVEDLRAVNPDLAEKIQWVGSQLEKLSSPKESPDGQTAGSTPDHFLAEQQSLLEEWDERLQQIRSLPGFDDFMSTPSFTRLQTAARDGPIIFLNTCERRSDAIIIFSTGPPKLINFPDVKSDRLEYDHYLLTSSRVENDRKEEATLLRIARYLWTNVVSLIVDCLSAEGIAPGSRVWWCPTSEFCLLPIHIAGLYGRIKGTNFPDLYISSYTPTVSALLRAKADSASAANPTTKHSLLFVGHSGGSLENVGADQAAVKEGCSGFDVKVLLEGDATPTTVLDELPNYPRVHFSCHGCVMLGRPLESFFQLDVDSGKQRLTVQDLISARLPNSELAFLSACHSAGGGDAVPDENLHLAAVLQFCGFRSVVGTMWEMYDGEGPAITRDFYKRLMKHGGHYSDAASALHFAVKQCRRRGMGIERWAMFVHFGA